MATLPEPSYIERNPEQVTAELVDLYETLTGKTLYPAQPERLFIDLVAYRESLLRVQIQAAAVQNLVRYASGIMLDELGALVGCTRLPVQPARTTLRITLSAPLGVDYTVPAGTECGSKDGQYTFSTATAVVIPAGQTTGDAAAVATVAGAAGNGYLPGDVNVALDLLPNVAGVVNLTTTNGGAEVEDDDHYRERIILKPDSYSTAGPIDAYTYWAKTAHQDIVDVAVLSSSATVVDIYPLMRSGLPSQEILDLVAATMNVRNRRPLTDLLQMHLPNAVNYTVDAAVTLYDWVTDDDDTAIAAITKVLTAYTGQLRAGLGTDIVQDQIRGEIRGGYRGIYKTELASPADIVLAENEWANCTGITVTIAGRVHG